jgi:hypothetical protein
MCVRFKFSPSKYKEEKAAIGNDFRCVLVGAPSKFDNIFLPGRDGDCASCVSQLRCVLHGIPVFSAYVSVDSQREYRRYVIDNISKIRSANLGCWCPTDRPCHGDALLEFARDFGNEGRPDG